MKLSGEFEQIIADLVCQILTTIYVDEPEKFRKEGEKLGNSNLQQMAAMSIARMTAELIEASELVPPSTSQTMPKNNGKPRSK